jgi:hypothetical protein
MRGSSLREVEWLGPIQLGVGEADERAGKVVRGSRRYRYRGIEPLIGRNVDLLVEVPHEVAIVARRHSQSASPMLRRWVVYRALVERDPSKTAMISALCPATTPSYVGVAR